MSFRHLLAVLFAGSLALALAAAAGPAFAGCDCNVEAQCRWFTLEWRDTCPKTSSGDMGHTLDDINERRMYERMAHGVAYAAQCWRLVQNDKKLQAALAGAPIALVRAPDGPIIQGESGGQAGGHGGQSGHGGQPDSVLARFRKADRSATERLYTIRIGSYESAQAALANFDKWKFLHPKVGAPVTEPALQDSLLSASWSEATCAGSWIADLFILPPSLSPSGRYDLDFRLMIDPGDASRMAKLLEGRLMTRTEVVPVQVTGDVLAIAIAE